KPANLVLTPRGQVKVLDFGLARFASEVLTAGAEPCGGSGTSHLPGGVTAEGMVLGTVDYIAPEQAENPHAADIRSDLYSLGCTLYFLLTGQPPFPEGTVMQKLKAHAQQPPPPISGFRPDVPAGVAQIVERLLAKRPADRFQTPGELAQQLAPFA